MESITFWDYILAPFYIFIILLIVKNYRNRHINNPVNQFIIYGLTFKIVGGIFLCIIYTYYYTGGDTIQYFWGANDLNDLLFKKPTVFFSILFGNIGAENTNQIINYHDWFYMWRDPQSYSIIRFTSLITFFGASFYIPITIILASLSYIGIWKLFTIFYKEFHEIRNKMAISILFIPSVVFWGSGLLKDTYTLSATCWLVYSFYTIFIEKKNFTINIIAILIMSYILFSVRTFMLYICVISIIFMITHHSLKIVKSGFIKAIIFITLIIGLWGGGIIFLLFSSNSKGAFKEIDFMLEKAAVTQQDLSRDYYGENSFNIGKFDPTISGILSKAPIAINAGLFYPYIWKANNPVMFVAGLENLVLLLLTLYVFLLVIIAIFKIGPRYMLKTLFDHPLIIFSLSYAIPFAFMVGLTTANYGALVRYKIPLIPFYLASLFIIIHKFNRSMVKEKTFD